MINLRALSNRNLAVGNTLIFALGGMIYSLATVLPVFCQTLMGYGATSEGPAVRGRGLGSIRGPCSRRSVGLKVRSVHVWRCWFFTTCSLNDMDELSNA
jgi:hypothetical protein